MKATLRNYRQAPRKVRLVADAVRGKSVAQALASLAALPKRAAGPMRKLIESAASNAKIADGERNDWVIDHITVDKGRTLHRAMPRAFGRATPIHKESSHVYVELAKQSKAKENA